MSFPYLIPSYLPGQQKITYLHLSMCILSIGGWLICVHGNQLSETKKTHKSTKNTIVIVKEVYLEESNKMHFQQYFQSAFKNKIDYA